MSEEKRERRVPKLRFKGFTDDWMQYKLKNIAKIIDGDRGKNYPSKKDFFESGHTIFLNASNITKNGFSLSNKQYITKEKSESMGNGKVKLNDIVLTTRGTVGNIGLYGHDIMDKIPSARINSGMVLIRINDGINPKFIEGYLNSNIGKKQVNSISFGSAQPQLTKTDISNLHIQLPLKEEQDNIEKLISLVNKMITLEQEKLTKKEQTLDLILRNVLARIDEKKPNIRFKVYKDDWITVKLKDICQISTGNKNTQDAVTNGKYPFYIRSEEIMRSNEYSFEEEAILVPGEGRLGDIYHYVNGKYALHQRVYRIGNFDDDIVGKFIYWNMRIYFKRHILRNTSSTTAPSIRKPALENYELKIPASKEEQNDVIKFLTHIDESIVNINDTIDMLKDLKKYLFANLFV